MIDVTSKSKSIEKDYIERSGMKSPLVLILSKSGLGKSSSMMNLNPETNYIINVMGKLLPFPQASKYIEEKNIEVEAKAASIMQSMSKVDKDEKFKTLCIDDGQYIMVSEFVAKLNRKDWDKWNEMAVNIYKILKLGSELRGDLKVFFMCHEDESERTRKMKTLGKLLDDKIDPCGMATIVLFVEIRLIAGKKHHVFVTQSDGMTTAKSPMGMFPEEIPNDLQLVSDRITEYYEGVSLENSKLDFTLK